MTYDVEVYDDLLETKCVKVSVWRINYKLMIHIELLSCE